SAVVRSGRIPAEELIANYERSPIRGARLRSARASNKELPFINRRIHRNIEKSNHHLRPCLFTPTHRCAGIGIVRVVLRIVERRNGLQYRTGLERNRLRKAIAELPEKVITRNAQQSAYAS